MKNLSAQEDFKNRTMGKMSGSLTKADYLAGLLDQSGCLSHWGLERAHGPEEAQAAMKNAYSEQMQSLLRTSMRELWQEMERIGTKDEAESALLKRMREWSLLSSISRSKPLPSIAEYNFTGILTSPKVI